MSKKQDKIPENVTVVSKKKHPVLRMVLFILELMILFICVMGSLLYIRGKNNPRHTADRFYEALKAGDFDAAYDMMVPEAETPFINREMFALAMSSRDFENGDYHLQRQSKTVYTLESDSDNDFPPIVLNFIEKETKRFSLISEYEVEIGGIYVQDVSFVVPKYAALSVNGILLDEDNSRINARIHGERLTNFYEKSYTVNRMYSGGYLIEVSGDIYQPYTDWVIIRNTDTASAQNSMINIRMDAPLFAPEMADILGQRAYKDFQTVFQAALSQDALCPFDVSKFEDNFYNSDYFSILKDELQPQYDGFYNAINMRDFESSINAHYYDYGSGNLIVDVELTYTIEIDYQSYSQLRGTYANHTKTDTGTANFRYYYRGEDWYLCFYNIAHGLDNIW